MITDVDIVIAWNLYFNRIYFNYNSSIMHRCPFPQRLRVVMTSRKYHHLFTEIFRKVYGCGIVGSFVNKNASFAGDHYNVVFKYLRQRSNGLKICLPAVFYICAFLVSFGIIKHL
jgi:hypothetical protein